MCCVLLLVLIPAIRSVAKGFGGCGVLVKKAEDVASSLAEVKRLAKERKLPVLLNAVIGKSDFRKGSISV